ncbi:hypothetical protein CRG98_002983 [Punica granatum]|uniref:Angiotensin-converting enzyme 2 n=1 Tax=Punica granatum TaxID=22663 RepID=A0A2I0L7I8_PUNGR|nr:hypothetical protein CRG98_002983 [Punica granatum]
MKNPQAKQEVQSSNQASHDSQSDPPNNHTTEAPLPDSSSISTSSNENKKVSRQDIELVQNLIERCLQLYMNKDEVVKTLLHRARIDPGFTTLVWQKLEEENADFFRAYYIRLKLKKQILLFNHLLEHQYHLMKYPVPKVPLAPIQNGIHPMPVNNLPMGYPVLQQPPMPAPGQPHLNPMQCGISSYVASSVGLQLVHDAGPGNSRESLRSLDQIQWSFSLSDLTADLSNLGDLGALGNYPGSPFLPSDSEILLDSPEQEDIVEEFFVDSIPGPPNSQSDEERS